VAIRLRWRYQSSLLVAADVYTTGGSIEKTKGWGFRGAYVHNWTPNWQTSVFGSYTNIDYNATLQLASALRSWDSLCRSTAPVTRLQDLAGRFAHAWTPVKNLTFSGEVMYTDARPVEHWFAGSCCRRWRQRCLQAGRHLRPRIRASGPATSAFAAPGNRKPNGDYDLN
jgi:hypothetical protein